MQKEYDILLVGQGLAGSLLAWSLLQRDLSVYIVADAETSASQIAAGIINPVTGQRFVLAESTPQMLSKAASMYQQLEQSLHISCYHPTPMWRLFNHAKEQLHCQKRFKQAPYDDFFCHATLPKYLHAPFAGIQQQHTAWLDTNTLLDSLLASFKANAIYQQATLDYTSLHIGKHSIAWHGITAKRIIFCEGYQLINNPYFAWLPLQPAHGEIITCTTTRQLPSHIINQSKWLLPTSDQQCKIGATYAPNIDKPTLQQTSQQSLLRFANTVFQHSMGFQVTKHQAGIRPATLDKQPFLGFHAKQPHMGVFNGFGSRGSLLIPWYAEVFSQYICQQQALPQHVNINRYQHLCV